jgi:mRNA interferase MazF
MLKRSDIVQIPFPFSDLSRKKCRPVLLLSQPDKFGDFLAAAITSQAGHEDAIVLQDDDLIEGHLPKASWVRATKLFSLNSEIVVVILASLKPEAFAGVHRKICASLGCE